MGGGSRIRSVAVIGAGAAGAVTAAALKAEEAFDVIRVFERRESPGGTWLFDADVQPDILGRPGALPTELDLPFKPPPSLPAVTKSAQESIFAKTPVYKSLTTNVPDIAMCFSDARFAYGPFTPHHVPRQYIENYFSIHKTDAFLELDTSVEDLSKVEGEGNDGTVGWRLVLRKRDVVRDVDVWWEESFDAVIIATGHYSVPKIPRVKGLEEYIQKYPGRVIHSKTYRAPEAYEGKNVLVIGNSASGHDVALDLVTAAKLPLYQSRRSKSKWDDSLPQDKIEWKPVISEFLPSGRIAFADGTHLDDVDVVIYCTGYDASFPFWNVENNGRPLWDYREGRLIQNYWHTFFQDFPTLGIVGMPRVLTFRSFEYQAIALARLFANRNALPLPSQQDQRTWETQRALSCREQHTKFHDIGWDDGATDEWLGGLHAFAGLGTLRGLGRVPPPLTKDMVWAIENIRKYDPPKESEEKKQDREGGWLVVQRRGADTLGFV